jgi:hypothetical protein
MVSVTVSEPLALELRIGRFGQAVRVQQVQIPQLHLSALHQNGGGLDSEVNLPPVRGHGGEQSSLQGGVVLLHDRHRQPSPGSRQSIAILRRQLGLRGAACGARRGRGGQQERQHRRRGKTLPPETHFRQILSARASSS